MRNVLVAMLLCLCGQVQAACSDNSVFLRGDWGQARFSVTVADTFETRAQGLMNVPSMPASSGMLFVYDSPQRLTFWMKNTLIPLDMLFIDETGTVRFIHHMATPLDLTPIDGGDGLTSVLEINGGLAKSLGITVGTTVRHPTFDTGRAAWPCE